MSIAHEITVAQLPGWLDALGKKLQAVSFAAPLKKCLVSVRSATQQNFAKGRAPDGSTWAPLKFARVRGGGKPLRDTGLLMASVVTKGAKGAVEKIDDTSLLVGTNLDRAAIHQHGGIIRPKGKALAIPLTRAALNAGSPRRMSNLHLVWPKGAKAGWLESRGGKAVKHFLLVSKVRVPARPFLGWNSDMADECGAIIGEWTEQELAKT